MKESFQRQVAAYQRIEDDWRQVQDLNRMARETFGLQLDSRDSTDKIEISDELRQLYKSLREATAEFKSACEDFDRKLNS